jgi:hypothetical protein
VERRLLERPDVFRAFYTEFYGANNDRKSTAWIERVGGDTVQDYAKYWYVTFGKAQGYSQRPPPEEGPPDLPTVDPPVHDPSEDPWNHPAIFPDWRPPYEGWEPPPNIWHSIFRNGSGQALALKASLRAALETESILSMRYSTSSRAAAWGWVRNRCSMRSWKRSRSRAPPSNSMEW